MFFFFFSDISICDHTISTHETNDYVNNYTHYMLLTYVLILRSYKPDIEGALQIITNHDVTLLSVESLNVILSAFAERGDVLNVLQVLEVMRRAGVKPNADSYSFAVDVRKCYCHYFNQNYRCLLSL